MKSVVGRIIVSVVSSRKFNEIIGLQWEVQVMDEPFSVTQLMVVVRGFGHGQVVLGGKRMV